MPLLCLLQTLQPFFVVKTLLFSNSLEHVLDSRHHSFQTTEVDMSTVLELFEDLVSIFFNLVLDVHFTPLAISLFTRQSIVNTKVVWESFLSLLEFIIIQKSIAVSNTQEQPSFSFVCTGGRSVFVKKATDETSVGRNSSSRTNHNVISRGVFLGQEHDLSCWSGHLDFVT